MSRGRRAFNSPPWLMMLILGLILCGPSPLTPVHAYYNFGMHWKGGFNPQQLGADLKNPSGFTLLSGNEVPIKFRESDDQYSGPYNAAVTPSGDILVADENLRRVSRYTSTGTFVGWIGTVGDSPTGGAPGCAGAAFQTMTPGWCTGGSTAFLFGGYIFTVPTAIAVDSSGNFYVTDGPSNLVAKFNSAGVLQGWIGKIAASPTGGAPGCAGAAAGSITPGWCTGGRADSGSEDGAFNYPVGIALDASGNIYVVEVYEPRISKFNSSGVFQGWVGKIGGVTPTGGDAGCAGASAGTMTPGWCKGGTKLFGNMGDGTLAYPSGLAIDSGGNLYVSDYGNHQINKYNSSGIFQGWIGMIDITPSGGAAGCTSAASGTSTPGWCTGGLSDGSDGDGAFPSPSAIAVDSSNNIYVTDENNSRVSKHNSAGVFQGWIGNIATSPTTGAAGCAGAATGSVTPGWCKGGTSTKGYKDGMLNGPRGLATNAAGEILVVDNGNFRVNKYSSAGAPLGAIQATGSFTNSWGRTGMTSASAWGDGMLSTPNGLAVDSSGHLFIADEDNHRVSKYTSSGTFLGWLGRINYPPTGGAAGCAGAASDTNTPGWCTGGGSSVLVTAGTDGSFAMPRGLAVDSSGNLFVLDTMNYLISKFNSSGIFQGWIGGIGTTPTGGAAGCTAAASGTFTPGWCKGGQSTNGNTDGFLEDPDSLVVDPAGNLFVTDAANARVSKYNSSGAFVGWIGYIATSPTGGAPGCAGAAAGTITPGWCTGGTSSWDSIAGSMGYPGGLALDGSGNIYVADPPNARISKYNSSGAFVGWIGKIGTSPTGGALGCNGAAVGSITPGWCTGGESDDGLEDGMFSYPVGIVVDKNGTFYVADAGNTRIIKYNSNGVFQGWFGKITSSPTGGDTGCKGAAVGTVTAGWCKGGASDWSGDGENGMMNAPSDLALDGKGYLYITDAFNNRIMRIWIGGR